jgi:GNAT superfamily N-acetyltransferase
MITFRQFELDTTEYEDALRLREAILRAPLGLALTDKDLANDRGCFHLGGFDNCTRLAAVLLLQPLDERTVQMRQVAVGRELQRTGIGSQLIRFAEEFVRQRGYSVMIAHARMTALDFYLRMGYSAAGGEFTETTVAHRLVAKTLL